ncbi:unnamed protein product [Diplocarpon coronariae]|nr:hypothetical protein JHW43_006201 [Diplocarpon mali]
MPSVARPRGLRGLVRCRQSRRSVRSTHRVHVHAAEERVSTVDACLEGSSENGGTGAIAVQQPVCEMRCIRRGMSVKFALLGKWKGGIPWEALCLCHLAPADQGSDFHAFAPSKRQATGMRCAMRYNTKETSCVSTLWNYCRDGTIPARPLYWSRLELSLSAVILIRQGQTELPAKLLPTCPSQTAIVRRTKSHIETQSSTESVWRCCCAVQQERHAGSRQRQIAARAFLSPFRDCQSPSWFHLKRITAALHKHSTRYSGKYLVRGIRLTRNPTAGISAQRQ